MPSEQQHHVTVPRRGPVDQQALHRLGRVGLGTRHRGSHGTRGRLRKGVDPMSKRLSQDYLHWRRTALRPFDKLRANVSSRWCTLNLRCPYHDVRASRQ